MSWKKVSAALICTGAAAAICGGGWYIYRDMFTEKTKIIYQEQNVTIGPMQKTIAATGTVEPEELVNVGAQVGGMITTLGTDANGKTIDYGSPVKTGMVLARIDDSLYRAEFDSATAQLLQASAAKSTAEAGLLQAQAKLDEAKANQLQTIASFKQTQLAWERAKQLRGIKSQSEYETAEAEYAKAEAEKAVSEATVQSAAASVTSAKSSIHACEAQLAAAQACLNKAKRNLGYCVISSPVDGVIIDRRVNVGQTVNSSMSAPSLFLIAKDLKKMQVWVSVNEADIGQIKVGQPAVFTVDAFQEKQFFGQVLKIRLNATMSQNVVTYVVEIGTDNSSLTLLPYLTANVKFILDKRDNVLSVPNAALRYVPEDARVLPQKISEKTVWVLNSANRPEPIIVKTGLNDGRNTEIVSGDLPKDAKVITGSRTVSLSAANPEGGDVNPFMAKMPPHPGSKKK